MLSLRELPSLAFQRKQFLLAGDVPQLDRLAPSAEQSHAFPIGREDQGVGILQQTVERGDLLERRRVPDLAVS